MAEQTTPFRNIRDDASRAINEVKTEADELMDALDFPRMSEKVQEFGKKNPIALAVAALTLGVAAGLWMRRNLSS